MKRLLSREVTLERHGYPKRDYGMAVVEYEGDSSAPRFVGVLPCRGEEAGVAYVAAPIVISIDADGRWSISF